MSYIKKMISREEKLLFTTRVHWIYVVQGVFWFVLLSAIGFALEYYLFRYVGVRAPSFEVDLGWILFNERYTPLPWFMMGVGFVMFWPPFLVYISTEVGLTSERIIHKKGLFRIETEQADLADISAEHVIHGFLGWFLRYGRVHFDCRLVDDIELPAIARPYILIRTSHEARRDHPGIDYTKENFERRIGILNNQSKEALRYYGFKKIADKVKDSFRRVA